MKNMNTVTADQKPDNQQIITELKDELQSVQRTLESRESELSGSLESTSAAHTEAMEQRDSEIAALKEELQCVRFEIEKAKGSSDDVLALQNEVWIGDFLLCDFVFGFV